MAGSHRADISADLKWLRGLTVATVSADQTSAEVDTLGYTQLFWIVSVGSLGGGSANILAQASATSGSGYATLTGGTVAAVANTVFVVPVNLNNLNVARYHVLVYDTTGMTNGVVGIIAALTPGAGQGSAARPYTAGSNVTVATEVNP